MGRKIGSKSQPAPVVVVQQSTCPKCGSNKRSNYANTRTLEYPGKTIDGREYTKVIWRNCWCEDCGQNRIDKTFQ